MNIKELNKGLIIGIGLVLVWIAFASNAMSQGHGAHTQHETPSSASPEQHFEATLSTPEAVKPAQMATLTIHIQDAHGHKVTDFKMFQEALMHLIVVSEDLQFFDHLHPKYDGHGNFEITTKFPTAGMYTLFSDYKPAGQAEQVSVLKLEIPGTNPAAPVIDTKITEKMFAETMVRFSVSPTPLKADDETMVTFDLREAATGQPVNDLHPYLGEKGHLVIIRQSPNLTRADYIHAHAMKDGEASVIQFMTNFPQPGLYKLWGQFNRSGTIITADFWVDVKQPEQAAEPQSMMPTMMGMLLEQMATTLSQDNVSPEAVKQVADQLKQMAHMMKQVPMMGMMPDKEGMVSMRHGKKMCKMCKMMQTQPTPSEENNQKQQHH